MNGYNFTERVRKALSLAREEAGALKHEYVGTEHILLGIIREGEGVATTVMVNLGADLERIRDDVIDIVRRGEGHRTGPDLPYTARAKKTLEFSMAEARQMNHSYVGTEHLLLGLLREGKGIAGQILVDVGITLDIARAETIRVLGSEHRPSPIRSVPAIRTRTGDPWESLSDPARRIVEDAYARAKAAGRAEPDTADLLESIILSSVDVSVAFTMREIDILALIEDVRRVSE